jgi:hypothetical protein
VGCGGFLIDHIVIEIESFPTTLWPFREDT